MSVKENIDYPLKIRRVPKKKRVSAIRHIVEVVRLEGLENRLPSQLSGGQKQRVALARALVFNPPVLLMDEPLSALDKKLRVHMQLELKTIQEKMGITVLYVTHDQEEALTMSDRIAVMNNGRIEQVGTPAQIYDTPLNRFVAQFVGETNLFSSCIMETSTDTLTASGSGNSSISLKSEKHLNPGIKKYLSVRPEKIRFINGTDINGCTLKGCLDHTLYLGDSVKHFVRLKENGKNPADSLVVMKFPGDENFPYPKPGQEVKIGWKFDDARVVA
jgi:ABC-type Fe3+/spermidine/putrescine transport system ATPase subunit